MGEQNGLQLHPSAVRLKQLTASSPVSFASCYFEVGGEVKPTCEMTHDYFSLATGLGCLSALNQLKFVFNFGLGAISCPFPLLYLLQWKCAWILDKVIVWKYEKINSILNNPTTNNSSCFKSYVLNVSVASLFQSRIFLLLMWEK